MESKENNSYASKGAVTTANTLGGVALGLSVLNGGLGNFLGGNRMPPPPSDPVATRYDIEKEREMTKLNAENGQLKAQIYTDQQVLAAERRLADRISDLADKVNAQNTAQAVLNAHQSDAIALAQAEIARYKAIFNLYINPATMAASEAAMAPFKLQQGTQAASTQNAG